MYRGVGRPRLRVREFVTKEPIQKHYAMAAVNSKREFEGIVIGKSKDDIAKQCSTLGVYPYGIMFVHREEYGSKKKGDKK